MRRSQLRLVAHRAGAAKIALPNNGFVLPMFQAEAKAAMMEQRPGLVSNVFDKLERKPRGRRATIQPPLLVRGDPSQLS